jgi:hypothetical protein
MVRAEKTQRGQTCEHAKGIQSPAAGRRYGKFTSQFGIANSPKLTIIISSYLKK